LTLTNNQKQIMLITMMKLQTLIQWSIELMSQRLKHNLVMILTKAQKPSNIHLMKN